MIKRRRKALGISQLELSELANVGINTVVSVETDKGNPTYATLCNILDVLGLKFEVKLKNGKEIPE